MVLGEIMLEHRIVLSLLLSTLAGTRNPPGVIMEAIEIIMLDVIVHSEERLFPLFWLLAVLQYMLNSLFKLFLSV